MESAAYRSYKKSSLRFESGRTAMLSILDRKQLSMDPDPGIFVNRQTQQ
jgi:hypothetical protein